MAPATWVKNRYLCSVFNPCEALDSVPHRLLLSRASKHGVEPYLLWWISNYLYERTQRVCVDGSVLWTTTSLSGVPQGLYWGHCCSLFTLVMSLNSSSPMEVYFFTLMTLSSTVSSVVLRTTSSFRCMHVDSLCGWTSSAYLNQTLKLRFESQQEVPVHTCRI